jgi:hypothetical protein
VEVVVVVVDVGGGVVEVVVVEVVVVEVVVVVVVVVVVKILVSLSWLITVM